MSETRKLVVLVSLHLLIPLESFLPSAKRLAQSSGIRPVLAQCQSRLDIMLLPVRTDDEVLGVLLDEAVGQFLESLDCRVGPPICELAVFVVLSSCCVECVGELVSCDAAERSEGEVSTVEAVSNWSIGDQSYSLGPGS